MLGIYDRTTRVKVAELQNALEIVETETMNAVCTLRFSLPSADEKNQFCTPFQYIRWDSDNALYRILDYTSTRARDGTSMTAYTCEHVVGTLIDDVIFGTQQYDNLTTREVLQNVLSKQTAGRWILGDCDFSRRFSYAWSNENLLAALFSVPNRFDEDYVWTFDTSSYPWIAHLRHFDRNRIPEYYIRDGKNLLEATKESKGSNICTRLYALGYGEGVNQLTLRDVNGGRPYIENPTAIAQYGLVSRIWEDARFEIPENLLQRANVLLDGLSTPYETYSVGVADLAKATGDEMDNPRAGKIVRWDDLCTFIVSVERHLDTVGNDRIELANEPLDIAGSIADLADRQRIAQVYAQGNTVPFTTSFADNADPSHPLIVECFIPREARIINKVIIAWRIEPFRAYETGAASGGGAAVTSRSGGGETTGSGGGTYKSTESALSGTTGTASINTTSTASGGNAQLQETSGLNVDTVFVYTRTADAGDPSHYHSYQYIGNHRHNVSISIPAHSHNMAHTHTMDNLTHSHGVDIPAHTHSTQAHSHDVNVPAHTHPIQYGIYEGPSASQVSLRIDGQSVPYSGTGNRLDITQYLGTDGGGKILRDTFHRVEIIPNGLTRIAGTLYAQMFIQSEGGATL